VNLPDVLFQFGRADLTPGANNRVRSIADVLNERALDRRILIEGHTDSVGSSEFNQQLSERRAQSVTLALESQGCQSSTDHDSRIRRKIPGAPNTNPNGTDNPGGREKNRRVEVVIQN